jgi:DNA (cytosine-5)-methyltransferase 1
MGMKRKFRYVELFAGCGGMSLGLEAAGFNLAFASEISPMAAETYAYNLLPNKLEDAFWIKSNYDRVAMKKRLSENPNSIKRNSHEDFKSPLDLPNKRPFLLVGDISTFIKEIQGSKEKEFRKHIGPVDLLSGGPPCQSFSSAGKREANNKRNNLFLQFARMASILQPKIVLFENVSGILRPFTNGKGTLKHAWFEITKEFIGKNYVPACFHIDTKDFGFPQQRRRFFMIALNKDLLEGISANNSTYFKKLNKLFGGPRQLYQDFHGRNGNKNRIPYNKKRAGRLLFDSTNGSWQEECQLLFGTTQSRNYNTVKDAIDSIKNLEEKYHTGVGKYGQYLKHQFASVQPRNSQGKLQNHENRTHTDLVKVRFMLLQAVTELDDETRQLYFKTIKRSNLRETGIPNPLIKALMDHTLGFLDSNNSMYKWGPCREIAGESEVRSLIVKIKSRKYSQRALIPGQPSPAQLSIPDDLCHYDKKNPRTLTAREMARIQTFPDWFVFKNKPTTGGQRRSYEVPWYTQIGNAVPPLLAKVIGSNLRNLLEHFENR